VPADLSGRMMNGDRRLESYAEPLGWFREDRRAPRLTLDAAERFTRYLGLSASDAAHTTAQRSGSSASAIRMSVRRVGFARPPSISCQCLYPMEALAAAASWDRPHASRSARMRAPIWPKVGAVRCRTTAPSRQ
jgi:hypothetical protein